MFYVALFIAVPWCVLCMTFMLASVVASWGGVREKLASEGKKIAAWRYAVLFASWFVLVLLSPVAMPFLIWWNSVKALAKWLEKSDKEKAKKPVGGQGHAPPPNGCRPPAPSSKSLEYHERKIAALERGKAWTPNDGT